MKDIKGSITALITPFQDGAVDWEAFEAFVDWQIAEGTHGLVPCGTTGESATLSLEEHDRLVALCIRTAAGRVPVIAGCGSNATATAIDHARHAEKAGADAILLVSPYYNKPGQEGLYAHFRAVHDACGLPVVLYNIPGRSAIDIHIDTLKRLRELPRIVGIKDATGDLARVVRQRVALGSDFIQLSGEDATAVGFNAMGGVGCISVSSNVAPQLCARMQEATLEGRYDVALALQDRLASLHEQVFSEPSPAPAKYAAHRLGLCADEVRLPLLPLSEAGRARMDAVLAALTDMAS
ncbi:MAG: 4-hydroxy-tetrahydrodipicolinate synthase [Rhodothalassiaceae bacterium]